MYNGCNNKTHTMYYILHVFNTVTIIINKIYKIARILILRPAPFLKSEIFAREDE